MKANDMFQFTGENDNDTGIVKGDIYTVHDVGEDNGEPVYKVIRPNKKFNPDQPISDSNMKDRVISIFSDEVRPVQSVKPIDLKVGDVVSFTADDTYIGDANVTVVNEADANIEVLHQDNTYTVNFDEILNLIRVKSQKRKGKVKKDKSEIGMGAVEEPADPELKGMAILTDEEEDTEIKALINSTPDLLGLAASLYEENTSNEYRLGGVLYHVRISKAYKSIKPEYSEAGGFEKYCEEQLGTGYTKAMYLVRIYTKWNKLRLDTSKIQQIGWVKAKELVPILDATNADQLFEMAKTSTIAEVKDAIKTYQTREGVDTRAIVKKKKFDFRIEETAGKVIDEYLIAAMDFYSVNNVNAAFEHIMMSWASANLGVDTVSEVDTSEVQQVTA